MREWRERSHERTINTPETKELYGRENINSVRSFVRLFLFFSYCRTHDINTKRISELENEVNVMNAWTKYSNNNMIKGSKFQDDTVVVGRSLRSLEMQINEGVKGVSDQLNEVRTKPMCVRNAAVLLLLFAREMLLRP